VPQRHYTRAFLLSFLLFTCLVAQAGEVFRGPLRIEYRETDAKVAERATGVLERALEEYAPHLPAGDDPIRVVVCHTKPEFARYAGPYTQPDVAGVALPDAAVIAVKSPRLVQSGSDIAGTLRHELVHVLLARNVNVDRLPRWLNEGIAMSLAHEHRWGSSFRVGRMYLQGRLISARDLEWAFMQPGREMEFGDAYAQALSMTRYLRDRLGEEGFWELIYALDEMTFLEAMKQHTSMTIIEFYDAWKASLWKVALIFWIVSGFSIFQVMAILTIVGYLRKRRRGQRKIEEWEAQEAEENGEPPLLGPYDLEDQDGPYPWEEEDEEYL
jgi:hypothetical protein